MGQRHQFCTLEHVTFLQTVGQNATNPALGALSGHIFTSIRKIGQLVGMSYKLLNTQLSM